MALPFDSPGHLERRIAARMAADESGELSLGISRMASSLASMSMSTEDDGYYNERSQGIAAASASRVPMQNIGNTLHSSPSGQRSRGSMSGTGKSATAVLAPRPPSTSSIAGPTLAGVLAATRDADQSISKSQVGSGRANSTTSQLSNSELRSHASASDLRVRSPPLTSTPHPSTMGQRTVYTAISASRSSIPAGHNHSNTSYFGKNKSAAQTPASNNNSSWAFTSAVENASSNKATSPTPSSGQRTEASISDGEKQAGKSYDDLEGFLEQAGVDTVDLDDESMGPLRESDLADTSSRFRSRILRERFDASVHGDESWSEAIIKRKSDQKQPLPTQNEDEAEPTASQAAFKHIDEQGGTKPIAALRIAQLRSGDDNLSSPSQHKSPSMTANSTPKTSKVDQERMKAYVLNSVKAVNPLRQAQLRRMTPKSTRPILLSSNDSLDVTPLPAHLRREVTSATSRGDISSAASYISEGSSTSDLTMAAKRTLRGNTSLPDVGGSEVGYNTFARIDPIRLHSHLKKINDRLEAESCGLREENQSLQSQLERALLDCDRLRKQVEHDRRSSDLDPHSTTPVGSPHLQKEQEHELDQLRRDNAALNNELDDREALIDRLEVQISQPGEREDLQERIADLESDLQQEREARQDDEEHYRIELQAAEDDRDRFKRQLDDERQRARAEIERMKAGLARAQDMTQSSDGDDRMKTELRNAEERLDEYSVRLHEANLAINEYQECQMNLEAEIEEHEQLKEQCQELTRELEEREAEVEQMRKELDEAKDQVLNLQIDLTEKENDRLTLEFKLAQAKESGEAKQLKEKIALLETTLALTREAAAKGALESNTEHDASGDLTPMHPSVAALRKAGDTPRSPPAFELSNASWLQSQSSLGENALRRDLSAMRREFSDAREAVDRQIETLSGQNLFKKIVESQEKIDELQAELSKARIEESRRMQRLTRLRCGSCKAQVQLPDLDKTLDSSVIPASETSVLARSTRSASERENAITEVKRQLDELKARWAVDQAKLQDEREELDAEKEEVRRMRHQQRKRQENAKKRAKQTQNNTLRDLSRARRIIGEFERELQEDFAGLQQALDGRQGIDRETADLESELERTRQRLAEIEEELKTKVDTFERLDEELREASTMDESLAMHVQTLQIQVDRFAAEVERLRNERKTMLEERQTLHARHRQSQQQMLNVQEELRGAREAIFVHHRQLDEQVETIEALNDELRKQNKMLETLHVDRDRLRDQRREILDDVALLEADLRRVRDESRRFGIDLDSLRRDREHAFRQTGLSTSAAAGQAGDNAAALATVRAQYEMQLVRASKEQASREHSAIVQHQSQCRGLLLQIRYEKAKFMRESDLRSDLAHQKKYLLGLVGGLELSEKATARFVADLQGSRGHPVAGKGGTSSVGRARQRFKAAIWAVMAISRAQVMARNWRITTDVKVAVRQAHETAKKVRYSEMERQGSA